METTRREGKPNIHNLEWPRRNTPGHLLLHPRRALVSLGKCSLQTHAPGNLQPMRNEEKHLHTPWLLSAGSSWWWKALPWFCFPCGGCTEPRRASCEPAGSSSIAASWESSTWVWIGSGSMCKSSFLQIMLTQLGGTNSSLAERWFSPSCSMLRVLLVRVDFAWFF